MLLVQTQFEVLDSSYNFGIHFLSIIIRGKKSRMIHLKFKTFFEIQVRPHSVDARSKRSIKEAAEYLSNCFGKEESICRANK